MVTKRVQFKQKPFDVFIARPSKWGNPFPIRKDRTREQAVALYEKWIRKKEHLLADIGELENKVLGCFCEENQLCHGDILIKLVQERQQNEQVQSDDSSAISQENG